MPRDLRLQIANGARHFRLLAGAPDPDGVELRKLGAQLAIRLLQPVDRHLVFGPLLGHRQPVVPGIEATELVHDIKREYAEECDGDHKEHPTHGSVSAHDQIWLSPRHAVHDLRKRAARLSITRRKRQPARRSR